MSVRPLLPALLGLAAAPAVAQGGSGPREDGQLWMQVNTNVPLADGVRVTLEQIARVSDRQDGLYQSEFGALLGLRLARRLELGLGYRKVGAHNGNTGRDEDRFRQQVVGSIGRVTFRFRVDERFDPRGREPGFRVRPLLRYNHPLGGKLGLFVSHESFWLPNTTAWGQRRGYDRMRNIVGAALPIGGNSVLDIGYLNQFRPPRGRRAQMDHALTAQLTVNLKGWSRLRVND